MIQNLKVTQKRMNTMDQKNEVEQVGGWHYGVFHIKPWDEIARLKLNWFQGEALKYLCRNSLKGGLMDINKAISIAEKAKLEEISRPIELSYNYGQKYNPDFLEFYAEKVYGETEELSSTFIAATTCILLCKWDNLIINLLKIRKLYYGE